MLSNHIWLIVVVYAISIAICDYAVTVGNVQVSPKHKDYKKFKENYQLIKSLCFVPIINTLFAVYYIMVWTKALFTPSKRSTNN